MRSIILLRSQMKIGLFALLPAILLFACIEQKEEVIRMALVPSVETGIIEQTGKELSNILSANLGKKVVVRVPTSYSAVVEGLRAKTVDVAFLPTLAFVLGNEKYGLKGLLTVVREGKTSYRGAIFCRKGIIHSFEDLRGKKFAYVDASSTSGYLYARWLLKENGVEEADFSETYFAGGHDKVIFAIFSGKVDAGAAFFDVRSRMQNAFPNVVEQIEAFALTEPIPNDTITVRPDFAHSEDLKQALLQIAQAQESKTLLKNLYQIDGFTEFQPEWYEPVRKIAKALGIL